MTQGIIDLKSTYSYTVYATCQSRQTAMSSSPGLPSPSRLFSTTCSKSKEKTKAIVYSLTTNAGFNSASALLRHERFEEGAPPCAQRLGLGGGYQHGNHETTKFLELPKHRVSVSKAKEKPVFKNPRIKSPPSIENVSHNKSGSKPTSTETETADPAVPVRSCESASNNDAIDVLPSKKSRKKKYHAKAQTTLSKPKVTKPKSSGKNGKEADPIKSQCNNDPETLLAAAVAKKKLAMAKTSQDICLEGALRRRSKWTPVHDTSKPKTTDMVATLDDDLETSPKASLGDLLGQYGFARVADSPPHKLEATDESKSVALLGKRKIELVNGTPSAPLVAKLQRRPSNKKKPRTLTEKATEDYIDIESDPTIAGFLMLPPDKSALKVKKASCSKSVISNQHKSVLQSPESAMKATIAQDVVFGTSSQLVREDSPTLLREIQKATRESEKCFPADMLHSIASLEACASGDKLARSTSSRSLWSVASRDVDGALLEAETIDLIHLSESIDGSVPQLDTAQTDKIHNPTMTESSICHENQTPVDPVVEQKVPQEDQRLPRSVAESALKTRPKSRSPSKKSVARKKDSITLTGGETMPRFGDLMDHQLKKEIKARGFKAIKSRQAMIELLEKCWQSQQHRALGELPTNLMLQQEVNLESTKDESEKSPTKKRGRPPKSASAADGAEKPPAVARRPRGRPKKDGNTTTPPPKKQGKPKPPPVEQGPPVPAEEIYDSDPPTPSPPRRRTPLKPVSPLPLTVPSSQTKATGNRISHNKDPEYIAHMHQKIGEAVVAAPPSHDLKAPTWREKMLMYDPIVIEDFTSWLNTEGLSKIGEDDEVDTGQVKAWCESKSICCLWRESLWGGKRARY